MAVWTIAAQEGTAGDEIAAELAASANVPLLDRHSLACFAHELDPAHLPAEDFERIEERVGGLRVMLASSLAMSTGAASAAALEELQLRHRLPDLGRAVVAEAARRPCVILAPAAFAALAEHPGAIHVRLRAPFPCRVAVYQREHVVDRSRAEKAVKHDDRAKSAWVRSLYHVEIDDDRHFTLAVDASRLSRDRLVETLLAAAGG